MVAVVTVLVVNGEVQVFGVVAVVVQRAVAAEK